MIGFAFLRRLRDQCIGSLQTEKVIARVFRAQLLRYRHSFSEPLLARIEHKQKRLGVVPGPAAFLCYPLERSQTAFLRTAYATDTDDDFYGQRERPDGVIIKAYGDLGIVKRRI